MPTVRRGVRLKRRRELTDPQYWELVIGPAFESAFADEADRLNAWREHRDDLIAGWRGPGREAFGPIWGQRRYDVG